MKLAKHSPNYKSELLTLGIFKKYWEVNRRKSIHNSILWISQIGKLLAYFLLVSFLHILFVLGSWYHDMYMLLSHRHSLNLFPSSSTVTAWNRTGHAWVVTKWRVSEIKRTVTFVWIPPCFWQILPFISTKYLNLYQFGPWEF